MTVKLDRSIINTASSHSLRLDAHDIVFHIDAGALYPVVYVSMAYDQPEMLHIE